MGDEEILTRYRGWLLKTAQTLAPTHRCDWVDLAQEGWIAMWRALRTYDPSLGAEATYLTTAARLRMTDCLRRNLWTGTPGRRGHVREAPPTPVDPDWDWVDATVSRDTVLAELEQAYHRGEIARALDELPADARERIRHHVLNDAGYRSWRYHVLPEEVRAHLADRLGHLRSLV